MAAAVPHLRPEITSEGIKAGLPVSADEQWAHLAGLANYCNGHGGMLIPWTAINREQTAAGAHVYNFYVGPKARAVERIWNINLRSTGGATAAVTCGGASAVTVYPVDNVTGRTTSHRFRESLAAKTSTVGG